MTTPQRILRWLLVAFFGGATLAVHSLIYLDYGPVMRLVFAATMILYGLLAFVSFCGPTTRACASSWGSPSSWR